MLVQVVIDGENAGHHFPLASRIQRPPMEMRVLNLYR